MAIFNSYVKLPEGILVWWSQKRSIHRWNLSQKMVPFDETQDDHPRNNQTVRK